MSEISDLSSMSEEDIVQEARSRGYAVKDAPVLRSAHGKRVTGSTVTTGKDLWMDEANRRLWKIQIAREVH